MYLGRYLYRGVNQERDILRGENGNDTFQYRDTKTCKMAQRTLPGADFLWLVLQHVLPKGLRRARNFGFLHPNSAGAIRLLQLLQLLHLRASLGALIAASTPRPAWRCAYGQLMHVVRRRMSALQSVDAPNSPYARSKPADKPNPGQAHTMH